MRRASAWQVGSRPNAYLAIGEYLGGFDAYRRPLLEHLSSVKFKHWDVSIRLLAAQVTACAECRMPIADAKCRCQMPIAS